MFPGVGWNAFRWMWAGTRVGMTVAEGLTMCLRVWIGVVEGLTVLCWWCCADCVVVWPLWG